MPNEIDEEILWSFLLVLARVGGIFALVPVPGWKRAPEMTKAAASIAITAALFPIWPKAPHTNPSVGDLAGWLLSESILGIFMGLGVNTLVEGFVMAAQLLGVQAGFSYASTIDPSTEADSGVLQVLCQLVAMLLFFSIGMEHQLLRALADSFQKLSAGAWNVARSDVVSAMKLTGAMWTLAVRIALPVVAMLLILDIVMALLGRINAQLQLLTIAFPTKLLVTIAMLALVMGSFAGLFRLHAVNAYRYWAH